MRIVIDMQGAQSTGSRNRGIGRYTQAIAKGLVRNRGEHEIFLALSDLFPETIEPIREAFSHVLPLENIRVWHAAAPVSHVEKSNDWRRHAAELGFESFLCTLKPDFIYVTSLFEGLGDDAVTSVHRLQHDIPVAVTLYDLIPYINPDPYLNNPVIKSWYLEKVDHLRRADLWLGISESSRQEGIKYLGLPADCSINIGTDADDAFQSIDVSPEREATLRKQYGLTKPFVLYTGGIDHRKNVEGLIRAYALLPEAVRRDHQLAIVCSVQPANRQELERLAQQHGLSQGEVVLTGFVPDEDLLYFYNLCTLFVFPSWHEGFGLPALEAMRCGAPVIGANTSSLPEVIGWDDALFDPHSDAAIADAIRRGLTDAPFREALIRHGKEQSRRFSWDESARRTIAAMEQWHVRGKQPAHRQESRRPKLAYVSPLPPARTGIADYSAELLPELAHFYDIDVIVDPDTAGNPQFDGVMVRSAQWFLDHAGLYDRVVYHFGNSSFHRYMFPLLDVIPGVVVLHDFFLSGIVAEMDGQGWRPGGLSQALYEGHGYASLAERHQKADPADVVWKYPCSLEVIQKSLGLIVHSGNSKRQAMRWYGGDLGDWVEIPHMRDNDVDLDRAGARAALGIAESDYLVCAFGLLGPMKLNLQLLKAWAASCLAKDATCHLVFVGENNPGQYGQDVSRLIRELGSTANVRITGWADISIFRQYLAAADVGVQLRTLSRGETSGTVLDCMNYGKAVIVNANGSMADLDDDAVWKLPDAFTEPQLVEALETLRTDTELRTKLGRTARELIVSRHAPDLCAQAYRDAIERFHVAGLAHPAILARAVVAEAGTAEDNQLQQAAAAMARNVVPRNAKRQLLVDISELAQHDAKSGIQRVVRSLVKEWLEHPPAGFRVEPVYATAAQSYTYARRFTAELMGFEDAWLHDAPVDYGPGDIFLGLDLAPELVPAQRAFYQKLRHQGVQVKFVVYDLLCIFLPQYFGPGVAENFAKWLDVVAESDGAFCISEAVAGDLARWMAQHAPERAARFAIDWFHLGADIQNSVASTGLPADAGNLLATLKKSPSFLMVGTLEPRKGHAQILDAFERLWQENRQVNLVLVGKQGWLVGDLVPRLKRHPELGRRLFWLEGISDEYLEALYAASSCLIAGSYGEGFGLPLIEAAQHGISIIARDIPVFREVAGDHAYYFSSETGQDLAVEINAWLELESRGQAPSSEGMAYLTWAQSSRDLAKLFTKSASLS
ncbi:glycosyltransferase [Burkholderia sp. HI2500]|uniref:glycosyltransferase n=1 Tax=Burkholderia sp. HI2500 TaxID=2015358 RepID=UPI000B79B186|nr:glycosyltransferase [Burkholderia sp. HI2500]OXJ15848.1 glycosyl transferase family 1 [Burkholderia sp. HI2500]